MSDSAKSPAGDLDPAHERDLVSRAQAGDEAALEALLSACQDRVYRTALRFSAGDEESAAELAQEVLVAAYRKIRKFRGDSRLHTWLYRITANLAKNRYVVQNRERKRFSSLDAPLGDDSGRPRDFADSGVDPRQAAAGREMFELLQQRLDDLEPEWREVIVLRFFEDQSYEEIAEALDLPLGTVKSRISRARKALRELMKDALDEAGEDRP